MSGSGQTYGEARLEALQKKADYAVALLKLDQASGGSADLSQRSRRRSDRSPSQRAPR